MVLSSCRTATKKTKERVPWTVLEGPWKTPSPEKSNQALLQFPSSHTEICSIYKKCLFTLYWCPERAWEHRKQESKKIPETPKVHHVKRFEVKGVYGLEFFYLAEDAQPFYTQWCSNGKDVVTCGHEISDGDDNHHALCLEEYQQRKEEWIQCPGLCQQWYHEQCFFN